MKQSDAVIVIGLTGNTGSGKGTVSGILQKLGAYIVDADRIAHDVLCSNGAAYMEIVKQFDGILDQSGNIDRKKLGEQVFSDESKREKLVEITHKYILEEMRKEALEALGSGKYKIVVFDAPLLIEAGMHHEVDEVWLVHADHDIRLNRITARDGISKQNAESRMNSQTRFEELRDYADVVIENNEDLQSLERIVVELINRRFR